MMMKNAFVWKSVLQREHKHCCCCFLFTIFVFVFPSLHCPVRRRVYSATARPRLGRRTLECGTRTLVLVLHSITELAQYSDADHEANVANAVSYSSGALYTVSTPFAVLAHCDSQSFKRKHKKDITQETQLFF